MGADETVVKVRGKQTVVGFVTDAESGQLMGMDVLVQRDSDGFVEWLSGYVSRFGVESMVTDDLNTYKPVVERLGVDHQVCIAHARKWVWSRLRDIEGWDRYESRILLLKSELSRGGGRELLAMKHRVRRHPKLHRLVVELSEKWRSLTCRQRVRGMPQTNNCTEQAIGRSKIRYKTVRGYKERAGNDERAGTHTVGVERSGGTRSWRADRCLDTRENPGRR